MLNFAGIKELFKAIIYSILTLPRDIKLMIIFLKCIIPLLLYQLNQVSVSEIFKKWVKKHPNKPCIIFNDEQWSFKDLENYSNRIANLFQDKFKLKKGDCVALFMENRPQYVGIWFGLSKLGVITACINNHLKSKPLIHSIEIAKSKVVIYDEELEESILEVKNELMTPLHFIRQGKSKTIPKTIKKMFILEDLLLNTSDLFEQHDKVYGKDVLMYIYTSGTTGLPKPVIMKHNRYIAASLMFYRMSKLDKNDILMITLPIYHTSGGILGIGTALINGLSIVLRKKFSATNFFKEAVQYKCTKFLYIGEICRYLLNQPPSEFDRNHQIKMCIGNGLRANIHKEFNDRFGIKCVEVYGATEGNFAVINEIGYPGACGYIPVINRYLGFIPVFIIKIDKDMNPIRDKNGFCIQSDINEKGLLVGVIGKNVLSDFSGYAHQSENSNKKIIENLFKKNQRAFNTGDCVVMDDYGYIYFIDRLGDTFRWKGENVSTVEVENILSNFIDNKEVVVYGVEIPGQEGRAGMATLITDKVDIKGLSEYVKNHLTNYAKPLFVRVGEVEHTGTFKAKKAKLIEDGYNVKLYNDKTYYFDNKDKIYKELTHDVYNKIINGKIKF